MPSPFPGMDPYLEHPDRWPSVHQRFITYVGDELNTLLPARYVADIGERLYVVQPERGIYPDVMVVQHPTAPHPAERGTGEMAVALASDPPRVFTFHPGEMIIFHDSWCPAGHGNYREYDRNSISLCVRRRITSE